MARHPNERFDGVNVQVVAGLVQQQDVRPLEGDLRQRDTALLPACSFARDRHSDGYVLLEHNALFRQKS